MTFYKILFGMLICWVAIDSKAQSIVAESVKEHRWALYGGLGPNYYFNNLELANNKVTELNYSVVGRLMWEPEYFLSLGFETGYNRLYSVSGDNSTTGKVHIVNVAIPIQLVISMKFFKNWYGNFNMGQAILLNNVTTSKLGNFDASNVSLGDFAATLGYKRKVSERFFLGAEIKGYYSAKLQDSNIALLFMTGYRLW